ncbi:Uncharacterised protein [BD1-7 clade bacterium]|uniref:Uncharacterized protein n=1 Tax=BD1-7 clade bacterium TaxID=2029982 RepID=A0A5S9PN24_9GAMM|nr:Uncharacterised protein [BD1-7 clade bacterium]CAA0105889.1 Uncharacterised protein [BD1-7 clade bacterium]
MRVLLMAVIFLAFPVMAQQAKEVKSEDVHPNENDKKIEAELKRIGKEGVDQANEGTGVSTKLINESPRQKELEERWTNFLPVFGKEARERGYALPAPFGVTAVYLDQRQPFDLLGIDVFLPGMDDPVSPSLATYNIRDLRVHDSTTTVRFDMWLLPFLNGYFFFGRTEGQSTGKLDVCILPTQSGCGALLPNLPFDVRFVGNNTGAGLTLAGGISEWFASFDVNYTLSDLDISVEPATSLVMSVRTGWNGDIGIGNASFYVGSVYEDIRQTLDITQFPISVPNFPEPRLVTVEQEASDPTNYIVGGRWNFWDGLEVAVEGSIGIAKRDQILGYISYRF